MYDETSPNHIDTKNSLLQLRCTVIPALCVTLSPMVATVAQSATQYVWHASTRC